MSNRLADKEATLYKALDGIYKQENVFVFDTVDSTNTFLKGYATECECEAIAIARHQSAGRGRMGRSFHSGADKGLFLSLLTRRGLSGIDATRVTTLVAVAVARAIESMCPLDAKIKWVNDIYVDEKKLSGILVEGKMSSDGELLYTVIGIGVNLLKQDYPCEISGIATSIEECCGAVVEPIDLAVRIAEQIYALLENPTNEEIIREYKERSMLIGRCVTVLKSEPYVARVLDITNEGHLVVESEFGTEELYTGDVSVKVLSKT